VKSTVETLGPTRVRLAVEVPFDELKPSFDAAYKKIGAQIRIPGFRPGKAPARVIDQRVGRAAVLEEAVNTALPKAYGDAVRESGVRALGQPEIEVTSLDDGQQLAFTAEVDVRPEITLPTLDGLPVTVDAVEISEDEVTAQLDSLRERFATLTGVDRPVQTEDFVSIDLSATIDGEEVEGGSATNLSYEVGSGDLIDGLDAALVGLTASDTANFDTVLASGDHAGRAAAVRVTVNSVKERELPAVDDEFASLASEFDTVDELRSNLRSRLTRVKAIGQGAQARDRVVEALVAAVDFPLPESAIEAEVGYREHEVVHSLGHDDAVFEEFLSRQGQTKEEFTANLRDSAQKSVKAQFLLDAIADAEQVDVSEGELTEYLVRQAARYEMPPQQFANQLVEGGNLPALMADVRRNKTLATVLSTAKVTDSAGQPVDLTALNLAQLAAADAPLPTVGEAADDVAAGPA
jgi:trigger factor